MTDPLNPGAVRPIEKRSDDPPIVEDRRPWWQRLLTSLRPTASVETDKKTGKKIGTVGVSGHVDF